MIVKVLCQNPYYHLLHFIQPMTSHLWNCNFFGLCNLSNVLGKNGSYIAIKTFLPPFCCSISWKTGNVNKQIECVTDPGAMICDIFCDVTTQIDLSPIDPKINKKMKIKIKIFTEQDFIKMHLGVLLCFTWRLRSPWGQTVA